MSILNSQISYLTIWGRTFFYLTTGHRQISIPNCISTAAPCPKKSGDPISPSSALPAVSPRCWCASLSCIYAPCHVLSLPKSCSQLRSQLRSAGVVGAVAQRGGCSLFLLPHWSRESLLQRRPSAPINEPSKRPSHWRKAGKKRSEKLSATFFYCIL